MAPQAPNGAATSTTPKRFELPALNLTFGSLTEGTDIPPPLPSPILEEPPSPKPVQPKDVVMNGADKAIEDSPTAAGVKRSSDQVPLSPTVSTRGSIRRIFSKSLLNSDYQEQASSNSQVSRPPSRTASVMDDKKAKRSSGWFRRLRSSDGPSKRQSQAFGDFQQPEPKTAGPPAPKIPELSQWKSQVDVNMGDDLFKGIR